MNTSRRTFTTVCARALRPITLGWALGGAAISLAFAAAGPTPGGAPLVFLSLRGAPEFAVQVGEPLFVAVRLEAPDHPGATVELAPAAGSWAEAVEVSLSGGDGAVHRAQAGFQPEKPTVTLRADDAEEGIWYFPSTFTGKLTPGDYTLGVRVVIRAGQGWRGESAGENVRVRILPVSTTPEREVARGLALATEALLQDAPERAAALLDPLLLRDPDNVEMLTLRANVCLRGGNIRGAKACIDRALDVSAGRREHHPSAELLHLEARLAAAPVGAGPRLDELPAWSRPPAPVLERRPESPVPAASAPGSAVAVPSTAMLRPVPAPAVPAATAATAVTPAPTPTVASAAPPPVGSALVSGVVPAAQFTDARVLIEAAGQWAVSARAGSQYGPEQGSAARATGAPDVPGADDHPNAWCSATRDRGTDWLEVTFAKPVRASEVRVRQNNGPGAITKVEAIDAGGQSHVWWEGVDPYGQDGLARDAVWFAVRVPPTNYAVAKIKLTLNLGAHTRWKQVDAVQLVAAPGAGN